MAPKHKSGEVGNSDKPQRSREELPVSAKVCMYRKNLFYRVRYHLRFQPSPGGPGTYPPEEKGGRPQMPFPSSTTSGRCLHDSLLGVSGERRQVARYIVERAPQGPFDVSALSGLMEIFTS